MDWRRGKRSSQLKVQSQKDGSFGESILCFHGSLCHMACSNNHEYFVNWKYCVGVNGLLVDCLNGSPLNLIPSELSVSTIEVAVKLNL